MNGFAWTHRMPQQVVVTYPATGGCRGNGRKANLKELFL
jgi:hypothetical protein